MKKLIFTLIYACTMTQSFGQEVKNITITGKVIGNQPYTAIHIISPENKTVLHTIDIKNGEFVFKGKVTPEDGALALSPVTENGKSGNKTLFFTDKPKLRVEIAPSGCSVYGSPQNDAYSKYQTDKLALFAQRDSIFGLLNKPVSDKEKLNKEVNDIVNQLNELIVDVITINSKNELGQRLFKNYDYFPCNAQQQAIIAKSLPESFKKESKVQERVDAISALVSTQPGQKFTDLEGNTPDGKTIRLSDYVGKGKYVLVDFWASWCPPCRAEMPQLVEAYKLLGNKLEIVGVSLDNTNEAWKKGISDLNISWPQMSVLKGWKSELAKKYGVVSIPQILVIDNNGVITDRFSYDENLIQKLSDIVGQKNRTGNR